MEKRTILITLIFAFNVRFVNCAGERESKRAREGKGDEDGESVEWLWTRGENIEWKIDVNEKSSINFYVILSNWNYFVIVSVLFLWFVLRCFCFCIECCCCLSWGTIKNVLCAIGIFYFCILISLKNLIHASICVIFFSPHCFLLFCNPFNIFE